eukprot:8330585-Pyramimonas_sp.AAC.1
MRNEKKRWAGTVEPHFDHSGHIAQCEEWLTTLFRVNQLPAPHTQFLRKRSSTSSGVKRAHRLIRRLINPLELVGQWCGGPNTHPLMERSSLSSSLFACPIDQAFSAFLISGPGPAGMGAGCLP